jgi:hypothetical protein
VNKIVFTSVKSVIVLTIFDTASVNMDKCGVSEKYIYSDVPEKAMDSPVNYHEGISSLFLRHGSVIYPRVPRVDQHNF